MIHLIGITHRNHLVALVTGFAAIAMITLIYRRTIAPLARESANLFNRVSTSPQETIPVALNVSSPLEIEQEIPTFISDVVLSSTINYTTEISIIKTDPYSAAKECINKKYNVVVIKFETPMELEEKLTGESIEQDPRIPTRSMSDLCKKSHDTSTSFLLPPAQPSDKLAKLKKRILKSTLYLRPNVAIPSRGQNTQTAQLDIPFHMGVISSPAPNKPQQTIFGRYADIDDEKYLRKCVITQFNTALEFKYDCVIVNVYSCSILKNPPEQVIEIYQEVIKSCFPGAFKKIIFVK